jgi:hypothetical protein
MQYIAYLMIYCKKGVFVMTAALFERFAETIKKEAERLLESEDNEINPKGVKKDLDGFEYVYSLASLDKVIGYFTSFEDRLFKRKGEEKKKVLFDLDKETFRSLPCKIAFGLRGYIGAVSEDSMLLEGKNEVELQVLLNKWSKVNMRNGQEQDDLYQFLCGYERKCVENLSLANIDVVNEKIGDNIDGFINGRVERKLMLFKEVMVVSLEIGEAMFLSVWRDYNEMLAVQKEEKVNQQEYIDKVIDEKLQKMREQEEISGSIAHVKASINMLVNSVGMVGEVLRELGGTQSGAWGKLQDMYSRLHHVTIDPITIDPITIDDI